MPSLKRGQQSMVISGLIVVVVVVVVWFSPGFITNKYGEFQLAMKTYTANEERGLWMFRERMPAMMPGR